MGVPVVTLRGHRHAGRVGASIMHHVGLPELVADREDEYIAVAQSLASDPQELMVLRDALRPQMRGSAMTDLPLFSETLENAYRKMWVTWCNTKH